MQLILIHLPWFVSPPLRTPLINTNTCAHQQQSLRRIMQPTVATSKRGKLCWQEVRAVTLCILTGRHKHDQHKASGTDHRAVSLAAVHWHNDSRTSEWPLLWEVTLPHLVLEWYMVNTMKIDYKNIKIHRGQSACYVAAQAIWKGLTYSLMKLIDYNWVVH